MLEEMVASVMKKTLAQDFPHLKLPAAVFATIDSAAKSDAFDIEELIVHNEVTGEVFKAHITSYWYEYKLTVIDRFGNPTPNYPGGFRELSQENSFQARGRFVGRRASLRRPHPGDHRGGGAMTGPERYGHAGSNSEWQLTQATDGDAPLCSGWSPVSEHRPRGAHAAGRCLLRRRVRLGLYDFIQSEDTELTRLEITQRVRLKLQKREVILPESIEISIAFEDDAVVLHCSFRFAGEDERRELDVIIGAVSVEVVSE